VRVLVTLVALAAVAVSAVLLALEGSQSRPRALESIFQDDQLLLYQPPTPAGDSVVAHTMGTLKALGVDRVRLTVEWLYLLPPSEVVHQPPGFRAADPSAYPQNRWAPFDRAIRLARTVGLQVLLTVTAPGPLWAMRPGAPNLKTATHYGPDAAAFGRFAEAVGRRYTGSYRPPGAGAPLPRVSFWSIWNEPNQPGWLAPQWTAGGTAVSPRLYRELVDAAYDGLAAAGHSPRRDTILIGETAPEGSVAQRAESPMTPLPFLRALYCVDDAYHRLRAAAAAALGCPQHAAPAAFVRAHPGLFQATGFAHHPYSFFTPPHVSLPNPDFAPLADLGRLEHALNRIFAAYGVPRRLPLYLTEYGYETSPPRTIPPMTTLRQQSLYLNEAEYLAWRDPRVRALGQFELQDSAPDPLYPRDSAGYWSTFQTGLEFLGGAPKPALNAYRLPVFVSDPRARAGGEVTVWGMLRAAPNHTRQLATIQWRPVGGAYRPLARVATTSPSGFLQARVVPPGTGAVRISWTSPAGEVLHSRGVGISVTG
jgi:hypothetical protein